MMKRCLFLIIFVFATNLFAQKERDILQYDPCSDAIDKKTKKSFEKAYSLYLKGNIAEASSLLRELSVKEQDFATPFFVIGLIGVEKDNIATIEKFFPKVKAICPDFSHPLLYYYLGLIDYTYERLDSCIHNFQIFQTLAKEDESIADSLIIKSEDYLQWALFIRNTKSNPVPFNPYPIKNICTNSDEFLPFISLDKEKIFFTRRGHIIEDESYSFYEKTEQKQKESFCLSILQPDGSYDEGYPLKEPFNKVYNEGGASLTADNRELFYTVCKPIDNYINCDIYHSEWLEDRWSNIESAGHNVNNLATWESQPCISPDGKTLYFVSNRPGGYGGLDIWYCKRLPDKSWGKPINAGRRINTPLNEKAPFLHPDGVSFYFSSMGWKGLGGYDFFYLNLEDKNMKEPINLGYPINTEADEIGLYITLRNEMAYFASNNINGNKNWDIYAFNLEEAFAPKKAKLLKGNVSNSSDDKTNVSLELIRISDKNKSSYDIDPLTGDFAVVVLDDEDYLLKAKKEGFAFESKLITKDVSQQNTPIEMELQELQIGESYEIKDILFAINSYEITKESKEIIDAFVEYLNEYPKIRCTIEGHTDNIGNDNDNLILSENRAKAVADYIIKQRIRDDRIKYKGYGSKKPVADNSTQEGRRKNRRTVFKIDSM